MKVDLNDFILVTHRSPTMGSNHHSRTIWGFALAFHGTWVATFDFGDRH